MRPKVTLINPPRHVLETIWVLWEKSKVDNPDTIVDVEQVAATVPRDKLEQLFWQVLRQHIPVAEHIHFTFMLDGISVSLREQMVRHRIGTKVGDNIGVDIIPDIATSSWWSQSMRIQDMGTFADRKMYRVPETLEGKTVGVNEHGFPEPGKPAVGKLEAELLYKGVMGIIQDAYKSLVEAGVPMEDARELIPLGAQHSISWDINLQALLHVLGKRGCWILQGGIWSPIIQGMVNELVTKVHPMFARIVAPPCIDQDDNFKSCTYRLENARRMPDPQTGDAPDHHPPCPLYLCRDEEGQAKLAAELEHNDAEPGWREALKQGVLPKEVLISSDNLVPRHREMKARAEEYRKLWHADPYTWER